jgi:hypothetical protein
VSPLLAVLIGASLTTIAVGYVVVSATSVSPAHGSRLSAVALDDISAAAETLTFQYAGSLVTDARSCKIPMASVSVAKLPSAQGGVIRIRSGPYLSPRFSLTDQPRRIAVPYPAPFEKGSGTISVEGDLTSVIVGLTPPIKIDRLTGQRELSVWWSPLKPC